MQPFLIQLGDLTLIQLTNWRWSWRTTLLTSTIAPLLGIVGLGVFAAAGGRDALIYVVTGNMVLSLLFGSLGQVSSNLAYMRWAGTLDYFATLPVYRAGLVVATVGAFLLLNLPAVAITLGLGVWLLGLTPALSLWLLLAVPLISLALSGLGALIGLGARTPEAAGSLSTLATFLLAALGPVIIPPDRLPAPILAVSLLSPATYAASALRQTVFALPDRLPLALDLAVLAALTAGLLALVDRRLEWRGR